jgi:hypothetical protein
VVLLAAVAVALVLVFGDGRGGTPTAGGTSEEPSSAATPSDSWGGTSSPPPSTSESPSEPSPGATIPPAAAPPEGLGDDPLYNSFAEECFDGDMASCDLLYEATENDPEAEDYREYADTCAGRQPAGTLVFCQDAFPED